MRIAFISAMNGEPWGGSEALWFQTAQLLHKSGHAVLASVHGWPITPAPVDALKRLGIAVYERYPSYPSRLDRIKARITPSRLKGEMENTNWQRVLAFSPDLICISQGGISCGIEWMKLCIRDRIPYVLIAQANSYDMWPSDVTAQSLRDGYRSSASNYFVSEANKVLLESQIAESLLNCEVVRNPYSVPFDSSPEWPDDSGTFKLACVGRLEPKAKGQDLIIEIFSREPWRSYPIEVSIYGDGPCRQTIERLICQKDLSDKIKMRGYCNNVVDIWKAHHALILPSRYEGLPLAVVETMLCNRIPIVTDVAGNSEVIQDEVTGFIAQSPTVLHLEYALERAWSRRTDWKALGLAAGQAIRGHIPSCPASVFASKLLALSK
jgi:glycosyltransferase involved in cell wall biosynthesis